MHRDAESRGALRRRRRHRPRAAWPLAIAGSVLVLTLNTSVAGASSSASHKYKKSSIISSLPTSLQSLYKGTPDHVHVSPERKLAAKKTPYKLCFEDSYEGNAWRIAVREQLQRLAKVAEKKGTVASFKYSVSNMSPTLENSQLHAFIDEKCTAIMLDAGSETGDNTAIADAYKNGIPVIAFNNYVSSPDAEVVTQPFYVWGQTMAKDIAKRLHGKGTVIMLEGISGNGVAVQENEGAKAVWKKYPGLTILTAHGNWTPSTTSSAILQTLGTHAGNITAVWSTGSEAWYIAQAFQKAGRPIPYITSSTAGNTLALIKSNPAKYGKLFFGTATVPVPVADYAFAVTIRTLEGQRPKVSPIMFPLTPFTGKRIKGWYGSCMTQGSESPLPVPPKAPLTTQQLSAYFVNGKPISFYSYHSTLPKVCS